MIFVKLLFLTCFPFCMILLVAQWVELNHMDTQWHQPLTKLNKMPTATGINHAKGEQVNYWINQANAAAGKRKVLTKAGTVDAWCKRLADHLNWPEPDCQHWTHHCTTHCQWDHWEGTVGLGMPTCPGVGRHRGCMWGWHYNNATPLTRDALNRASW